MSRWSRTLDALVRERGPALFGYAYVLTGSVSEAEDLLQEALVRTFRSPRSASSVDAAHAYVKRAIGTSFIDSHRRTQARPQRHPSDDGDYAHASAATEGDPAQRIAEAADLHSALLRLPPRERACVALRYLQDLPLAEVAAELGLAVGTVKRYVSDGVARLRQDVGDLDFDLAETIPVESPTTGGTR